MLYTASLLLPAGAWIPLPHGMPRLYPAYSRAALSRALSSPPPQSA